MKDKKKSYFNKEKRIDCIEKRDNGRKIKEKEEKSSKNVKNTHQICKKIDKLEQNKYT